MSKLGEEKHIHTVLSTMGIEQFDPMVPTALDEYAARFAAELLKDARDYSIHAGRQEICPEDVKLAVKLNDAYASGLDSRESVVSRARDVLQKRNWTEFADPRSVQIRYPPGQFSQRSHTYVPGGEAYTESEYALEDEAPVGEAHSTARTVSGPSMSAMRTAQEGVKFQPTAKAVSLHHGQQQKLFLGLVTFAYLPAYAVTQSHCMSRKRNIFTTYGTLRASVLEVVDLIHAPVTNGKKAKVSRSTVFAVLKVLEENGNILVAFFTVTLEKSKAQPIPVALQTCLGYLHIPLSRLEDNAPILQWHQLLNAASEGLRSSVKVECHFVSDSSQIKSSNTVIRRTASAARHGSEYNASRNSMYFDDYVDEVVEDEEEDFGSEEDTDASGEDLEQLSAVSSRERLFLRVPVGKNGQMLRTASADLDSSAFSTLETVEECHDGEGPVGESKAPEGSQVKLEAGIVDYCVILGPADAFSLLRPTHFATPTGALSALSLSTRMVGAGGDKSSTASANSPMSSAPYTGLFGDNADTTGEEQEIVIWDRLPRHDHVGIEMPSKLEWFACPEGSKTVLSRRRPDPYYQSFVLSSGGETEEVFGLSMNFFVQLGSAGSLGLRAVPAEDQPRSPQPSNDGPAESEPAWWRKVRCIDPNLSPLFRPSASGLDLGVGLDYEDTTYRRRSESPEREEETKAAAAAKEPKLWTVVSLCLLFRASQNVQPLRRCLEHAYYDSVLPYLQKWESQWEALVRTKRQETTQTPTASSECSDVMVTSVEANIDVSELLSSTFATSFQPFSLHVEKLMAMLCLECPVPIPGFLSVKLDLPRMLPAARAERGRSGFSAFTGTPRAWKGCADNNPALRSGLLNADRDRPRSVEFVAPSPEDFPQCSYPLEALLKCFGPRVLIDIVCCVLSESRMLFHSSDLALLPVICEGLRTLIYPLQWTHVYLPVVPMHLLNVVEAPVPYMLGTHSKWLKYIQQEYMNDMVLIDCDTASIDMGGSLALQLPEREDRWLMLSLKSILQPILPNHDIRAITHPLLGRLDRGNVLSDKSSDEVYADTNTKIQIVFFDVLFHLLRYVPDCLFYLNPSCPVFNRPLFISDYASDEYRAALELITVTNCFHVLTESIHTPSLQFFYKSIVRLSEIEKKLLDQSLAAEEAGKSATAAGETSSPLNNASQANLSAAAKSGRGPLRRSNSGGGGGRGFSRNVSVANIIYDKLVSGSTPAPSPSQGIPRQQSMVADAGRDDLSRGADSPKIVQHAGKGLMKHISILGISEGKDGAASRSFFGGASAAFSAAVHETPNESAYASLLPVWLLKPTHEINSAAVRKVDSVQVLLDNRIQYYTPFLKKGQEKQGDVKPASPKGSSDGLSRIPHSDAVKLSTIHVLNISCDYAVSEGASDGDAAAQGNLSTPLSKSQHRLPRSGSAHATPRSAGSFSSPSCVPSKGTPHSSFRAQSKGPSPHVPSPMLSLPVLTTVPSFRARISAPSPDSPLSRIFQVADQPAPTEAPATETDGDTIGFDDSMHEVHSGHGGKFHDFEASTSPKSTKVVRMSTPTTESAGKEEFHSPPVHTASVHFGHAEHGEVVEPSPAAESGFGENDEDVDEDAKAGLAEEESKPHPLFAFNDQLLSIAQDQVRRWSVADLAAEVGVPVASLLQTYSKVRSSASNKLCENTQFAARHRAIKNDIKQTKSILNPADTQATFDKLSKMGDKHCDECITMFLQKVVTESILEEHWLENAVQQCIKALQDKNNRRCLIDMLKNAKQSRDKRKAAANVYPLNSTAFEAFSKLFTGVLRICSNQEDFLCAYGLLEVGGLYFRLVVRDDENPESMQEEQDGVMEFLSERTCQHPIYHSPALWSELLKSRVPVPTATQQPNKNLRTTVNAVLSEVHALLFIMLELEVNSSRALLFIQAVASDYSLGINDYYKLQRFVNRIWANNHVDEIAAASEQDHHASALHKPEHLRKKRSKENMRDRRASLSIGDMLSMQGHNTSKLFRQSSVEAIRVGTGKSVSMKVRTEDGFVDGTGRSSKVARRGSLDSMDGGGVGTFGVDVGVSVKDRKRSKSLHANSSSLSIETTEFEESRETGSGKFRSVYPKELATPLPGARLSQIEEVHSDAEDFSKHSSHALQTAVSTTSSNHSAFSQPSSPRETGVSAPNSPRTDVSAGGNSQHVAASIAPDSKNLDDMLGLHRVSSAMLMRSTSQKVPRLASASAFELPKHLPNKFAPLELSGQDEAQVTAFDCLNSWLVTGSIDGGLNVTDLATGVCHSKFRHGSGSGEQYSGVTRIHCMSAPCTSSATSVFFSGCSAGILKAWTMPVESPLTPASPGQSSASSYWGISMNLRSKQSLSVMKVHAAPISYLVAKPSDAPGGWLLASGDMKGLVCLNRGSEKSSSATCCSTSMHSSASPRPSTASSAAAGVSCLAFIGATALSPSGAEGAAAGGGKAKTAKKGGTTGGAGSGMTAGMSGAAAGGSEQYLGVGTASGLISVLDLCTAQAVYQVSGHAGRVTQMIGLQSNEFITASTDRSIKLWDIRTRSRPTQNFAGKILEERSLGPSSDKRCATSPITAIAVGGGDNSLVISTSADGTVRLWDRRYDVNVPCSVSQGHSNRITAIAWNGVGEFHTASHDGTVRSWDSINGQNTHLLQAHEEEGITGMRMTSFRCAQHISITPRGPVTFTDYDKLSARTCLVTCGWNGTMRAFVYDV